MVKSCSRQLATCPPLASLALLQSLDLDGSERARGVISADTDVLQLCSRADWQ